MTGLLSNLVNNLSEGIHKTECKYGHVDKKCKTCIVKYKYCNRFLEYRNFEDDLIECNFNVLTKIIDKSLMKRKVSDFLIHNSCLTRITVRLFCCFKKVFIPINK